MTTETIAGPTRGRSHPGPPLAAPAVGFVLTFFANVLIGPISGSGSQPSPWKHSAADYFSDHSAVTAVSAWLTLLSAVALLVFAAVAWSRLNFLAPNAPGPFIAGSGGVLAAVLLAVSAVADWALSRAEVSHSAGLAEAVHAIGFVAGGPAHTVALGVLILGLAITLIFLRRTPRWLSVVGIVVAAVAIASSTSLLSQALAPLIPVGRFAGMLWLLAISFLIPRDRAARGVRGN